MQHPLRDLFLLLVAIPCLLLCISALLTALLHSRQFPRCPLCQRANVRPSRCHNPLDYVMSAARMPPFRCRGCLRRFYAFGRHTHVAAHSHR